MEAPIGIIDSGVGGLTVVKEMLKRLPNESIVYIGDDARCPYGPRPVEEVRAFTMEMASALSKMGIKMLVIACNTATAVALDDIRELFIFRLSVLLCLVHVLQLMHLKQENCRAWNGWND